MNGEIEVKYENEKREMGEQGRREKWVVGVGEKEFDVGGVAFMRNCNRVSHKLVLYVPILITKYVGGISYY